MVFMPCGSCSRQLLAVGQQSTWLCRPLQPIAPGQPSLFIRGVLASLRQNSLGGGIDHTTAESATANQLPQSGTIGCHCWHIRYPQNMIVGTSSSLIGIPDSGRAQCCLHNGPRLDGLEMIVISIRDTCTYNFFRPRPHWQCQSKYGIGQWTLALSWGESASSLFSCRFILFNFWALPSLATCMGQAKSSCRICLSKPILRRRMCHQLGLPTPVHHWGVTSGQITYGTKSEAAQRACRASPPHKTSSNYLKIILFCLPKALLAAITVPIT